MTDAVARALEEWEALDRQLDTEIKRPRLSIDGFLSLMRERDAARERYKEALMRATAVAKDTVPESTRPSNEQSGAEPHAPKETPVVSQDDLNSERLM